MVKKISIFVIAAFVIAMLFVGAYRMGLLGGKTKEYTYKEDVTPLDNPYIGYAPSADSEALAEKGRLVYLNLLWSELEPQEGVYRWDDIEEEHNLKRWRTEGKNLVLRFVCDLPSDEEHMDIPQWLYDKTGDGQFYDIEYGKGYCPDYNNEVFIDEHAKVIAEIGRHFESDGFLAYVELGSLGHWGEWHTYYPAGIPRMPGRNVREKYVDPYVNAFPYARLLMRRPFAEMPEGFGVFNDMTGHAQDTFTWLHWIDHGGKYDSAGEENGLSPVPNIWDRAPVGGEFTSSIPVSRMLKTDLDETLDMIAKSHMSFIGPKVPDVVKIEDITAESDKVLEKVGYRYRVSKLTLQTPFLSKDTTIKLTFCNDGVAPVYFDFVPCLYFEMPEGAEIEPYLALMDGYGLEGTEAEGMLRLEMPIDLKKMTEGKSETFSLTLPREMVNFIDLQIYAGIENKDTRIPEIYLGMSKPRKGRLTLLYEN